MQGNWYGTSKQDTRKVIIATIVYLFISKVLVHSIRYSKIKPKVKHYKTNQNRILNKAKQSKQSKTVKTILDFKDRIEGNSP